MTAPSSKTTRRVITHVKTSGLTAFMKQTDVPTDADKIASCEISDAADASERPEPVPADDKDSDHDAAASLAAEAPQGSDTPPLEKPMDPEAAQQAQDDAYAAMKAVRDIEGPLTNTTWTRKAIATLRACLLALATWGDDTKACDEIRQRLKNENGRARALNSNNPELVAIHGCQRWGSKTPSAELSRFANVVKVAREECVTADDAESWLKARKQADILKKARVLKGKKPRPKPVVAVSPELRSHIWNALQAGKGAQYDLAVEWLDDLENVLAREAQSVQAAPADEPKPNPPDERAADDATATAEPAEADAEPVTDA